MNRKSKITTLLAGVIGLVFSMYGTAYAAYNGSSHDFSGLGWSGGESCTVCHTPHATPTGGAADNAPLWDHAVNVQTYTPYSSITGTMDATLDTTFTGISKLCLTCHDGTLSMDNFGGPTALTGNEMTGANVVGTDLSNDHPVSFVYQDTITAGDTEFDTAANVFGASYTFGADAATAKVECASCHDVHNGPSITPFLRVTKANLCIACHVK